MSRRASGPTDRRGDSQDPVEAFIDGRGPLAAALRELPVHEPPTGMAAQFQEMLAGLRGNAPAFEPPARLETAVLAGIARQQAAQAARREAVLGEIARGADPTAAIDAELSPATRDWLRTRSGGTVPAKRRWRLPVGWWRYAGGGLAAVLALGVGLRMSLESPPEAMFTGTVAETESRSAAASGPQAGAVSGSRAGAGGGAKDGNAADSAMIAPPTPAAPQARPAPEAMRHSQSAQMARRQAWIAPADRIESRWLLSDDPAARLDGLPAGSRWILLCHPSEREAALAWLRRGLEALERTAAEAPAQRHADEVPAEPPSGARLQAHPDVPAGSLWLAPGD
ncbi:MAG: hypothetical protein WCZ28_05950 [Burkholderiaceae bacterium]